MIKLVTVDSTDWTVDAANPTADRTYEGVFRPRLVARPPHAAPVQVAPLATTVTAEPRL